MPPRQRPNLDNSRSEVPSGTRDRHNATLSKDAKITTGATRMSAQWAADIDQSHDAQAQISWSTMPLSVLHDYRHVYNLPCPSSYSSQINSILLSQGIGLQSPTALAARRRKTSSLSKSAWQHHSHNSSAKSNKAVSNTTPMTAAAPNSSGELLSHTHPTPQSSHPQDHAVLHRIQGQDRVTKDHLAGTVRKHFNNVAISEQDVIAKFLYKVREERKGRAFRLRFQP